MNLERQIEEYVEEARVDFISMCRIANNVRYFCSTEDLHEIRQTTLTIAKALMSNDIFPGDYTLESLRREGFSFWLGTTDDLICRIEKAWIALNRMPDVDDICWFALKPSGEA